MKEGSKKKINDEKRTRMQQEKMRVGKEIKRNDSQADSASHKSPWKHTHTHIFIHTQTYIE